LEYPWLKCGKIEVEGKVSSTGTISSAQRTEQYLNQNYFFAEFTRRKKKHLTSYSTSFR
jgi:hypothetical protein